MKAKLVVSFIVFAAFFSASAPVRAHHGNAAYEDSISEMKQAVITKFIWANPHSLIDFDVKNAKGEVVHWTVETAAPQALRLIGWSKGSLEPGSTVTIYLYAAKNGSPVGRLQKILRADGSVLHDTQLGGDTGGKTIYDPNSTTPRSVQ